MTEYVRSDGTEATALKIEKWFVSQGISDEEISKYSFLTELACCWWAVNGKIQPPKREAPKGFTEVKL